MGVKFGLSITKVRELAYETAVINNLPILQNQEDSKMAGIDWFKGKVYFIGLLFSVVQVLQNFYVI